MPFSSPKRKRDHPDRSATKELEQLDSLGSEREDSGDASPRAKTARRLERLEIRSAPLFGHSHYTDERISQYTGNTRHPVFDTHTEDETLSAAPEDAQATKSASVPMTSGKTSKKLEAKSSRSKSPPLPIEISDSFWQDSEITGHDPKDPDDDGYGINGIGFRPTAAIAWSRSQRRKQQVTAYRNREARDARQQRSERRKRVIDDSDETPSTESSPRKSVRFRFEDG
ncbi:hypothetical protein HRR83_007989 [Exophiala dermatitidis]|uniref:Uncharacterized protein n=2 Tax=Exophiala dermatitidis TaxID=5970 RepID=H6BPG9_EXODN|nr:uncharacterized protein HMPREF1120_02597 [Exophiala dermatitidis NIH/UT8656]KAJ4502704.1 hypothetical protein HRR73_009358 [Exophiala dermatitidis]EHY54428.1 hypothetical protein HMPREF1120_02597 [Exophiala dermatitidis NIH/UT8656]KAJ4503242.1 hypothetical protein HRR74_009366 [Exophiala dermatitidis]KAJ4535808.1 hypothetical protein HRR77_007752 [Exophiala dermatitidis]KAJ4544669.1 hypothetical protein HRR76_002720 [Exophiala dermatitidis]